MHARPQYSEDWIHTKLTGALPSLAVLKQYEQELGLAPRLSDAWKKLLVLLRLGQTG